jgi:hypothetical protein
VGENITPNAITSTWHIPEKKKKGNCCVERGGITIEDEFEIIP